MFRSKKMKAIVNISNSIKNAPATMLQLGYVEFPQRKTENEILIKIKAAAINRADILQRQGKYPPLPGVTQIIGLECSGQVVDWKTLQPTGESVMALLPGGGYADYVSVDRSQTQPLLNDGDYISSAAFPEVWCTAYQLIHWIAAAK